MSGHCPGQDGRNLRITLHKCPHCGAEVEIFSDETRAKCHQCGEYVYQEETPSCVDWCVKARECLGDDRWNQLRNSR